MCMWMVAPCQSHSATWRYFKIKFVKNSFILVKFTKLGVEVISNIKSLYRVFVIADVPNIHWQVVTRKKVVVTCWSEFCPWYWIDDIEEEMLFRRFNLSLKCNREVIKLGRCPQVAIAHVSFWRAEQKNIWSSRVVLHMGNYLRKFLYIGWLKIY